MKLARWKRSTCYYVHVDFFCHKGRQNGGQIDNLRLMVQSWIDCKMKLVRQCFDEQMTNWSLDSVGKWVFTRVIHVILNCLEVNKIIDSLEMEHLENICDQPSLTWRYEIFRQESISWFQKWQISLRYLLSNKNLFSNQTYIQHISRYSDI